MRADSGDRTQGSRVLSGDGHGWVVRSRAELGASERNRGLQLKWPPRVATESEATKLEGLGGERLPLRGLEKEATSAKKKKPHVATPHYDRCSIFVRVITRKWIGYMHKKFEGNY
ncbi:hypothetical protein GOP47_0000314 [Adiantum capillus-veneris]|uniref:Uncharacterized protein n=1 Tax=Adiantum capillus-veneris TaxID=13818 RepID=A0A9D4ZSZ0_ADICA|nr:hypothetical protein GOP47_0000314 [Adiantum capillus-veneris]